MAKKRTYRSGNEVYEIPEQEVDLFLEDNPNAVEVESFLFENDTFDIPLNEVDQFKQEFPKAQPLKKKDSAQISPGDTGALPSDGEKPSGFRTVETGAIKTERPEKPEYFAVYTPEQVKKWDEQFKRKQQYGKILDETIPGLTEERDIARDFYDQNAYEYKRLLMKGDRKDPEEQKRFDKLAPQVQENFRKSEDLTLSLELLNGAKKYIETSDAGVLESMVKSDAWMNLLDLGMYEIISGFDILSLAKKFEQGEELSKEEQTALFSYGLKQAVETDTEKTMSSMIGGGIAETIPFMVQFALSGPAAAGGKKAASEIVEQLLKKTGKEKLASYTAKAIGSLTGAAIRTPMLSDFYEGVAANQIGIIQPEINEKGELRGIPIQDTQLSPLKATTKSFGSTMVTALTEDFGQVIAPFATKTTNRITKMMGGNPMANRIGNKTLDQIKSATGFNGWIGEFTEEILEGYGQAILDKDQKLSDVWDAKSLLSTLIITGAISGSFVGAGYVSKGDVDGKSISVRDLRQSEEAVGDKTASEIDTILRGESQQTNVEQLDAYIKKKKSEGATEQDLRNVINYAANKSRVESMNQSIEDAQTEIDKQTEEKAIEAPKGAVPEVKPEVAEVSAMEMGKPVEMAEMPQIKEDYKGKIVERPEMENPVHRVVVGGEEIFLQRSDTGLGPAWFEVKKDEQGTWTDARPEIQGSPIAHNIGYTKTEAVEQLKTEANERKKLQEQKQREQESRYGEGKKITRQEKRQSQKDEVLTTGSLVKLAEESKNPREFVQSFRTANLSPGTQEKFFNAYGVGAENTLASAAKQYMNDLKQKPKGYAKEQQGRALREQGPTEGQVEGVSNKDLSGIYGAKLQDREEKQKQAIQKVGDYTKKTESLKIADAASVQELDYLEETGQVTGKESIDIRRKALERDNNIEDISGRIPMIETQRATETINQIQKVLESEAGGRVSELKEKKSELWESVSNRLGRMANIKYATGPEGKATEFIKEAAATVKELAEIGIINLELGARKAVDKLRQVIGDGNPDAQKLIDENYDDIVAEIEKAVPKKPKPKKAAPPKPSQKIEGERKPAEISKRFIEAEKEAIEKVTPSKSETRLKNFRKLFVDISENFKVALIKGDKEFGQRAVDYFNLQNGVSGRNNHEFNRTRNKIFGKWGQLLSQGEQAALEQYIAMNRIIELDTLYDKRGEERLAHPQGINLEQAQSVIDAMFKGDPEVLSNFGLETLDMEKIVNRSEIYYDVMRNNLKKLYDAGVINAQAYEKLKEEQPYYSRRQYVEKFVDGVDNGGGISGLNALSTGSFGALLTDLQTLLADSISRTNQAIARTKTLVALKDYAEANPESNVVRTAGMTQDYFDKIAEQKELPEEEREFVAPKWEKTPEGWTAYSFRDQGVNSRVYINNEFVPEYQREGFSEGVSQTLNILSWVTGNKILKAFATGYNPEFMVKNIPLDMLHILTTTEYYSPVYPVATAQMLNDIRKVLPDVIMRKGRFNDYVNEGGSMDFLTTQGSLTPEKFGAYKRLPNAWRDFTNAMAFVGNTSEVLTRLALRERIINNQVNDFKKEKGREPNPGEMKEIQSRATAGARNYLDFSQGGHAVKLLNSVIPYLNAGFQVTRGSLRAAQRNPKVFAAKIVQLGATATAITAFNLGLYSGGDDEEKEERKYYFLNDISDRVKADNFVIMTPYSYIDHNGNKRYVYFRFPKDNIQKPITGLFEGAMMKSVGIENGLLNKQRWMEVESLFQNITDLGNLPPLARATLGYNLNTDLYYKQPIWTGKDFGDNKALEYTPGKTPEKFIKFGQLTGLSPVRSQYFTQQFTTQSNVLGSIIGETLDFAASGFEKDIKEELNMSTAQHLTKEPFARRFFKSTYPYAKKSSAKDETQKENRRRQELNNHLKKLVQTGTSEDEIVNWIINIEDPNDSNRMMDRYISGIEKGFVDYRVKELSYISAKARANAFYTIYKEAGEKEREKLIDQSLMLGGIISPGEFTGQLQSLFAQDNELQFDDLIERINTRAELINERKQKRYEELMDAIEKAMDEKEREEMRKNE